MQAVQVEQFMQAIGWCCSFHQDIAIGLETNNYTIRDISKMGLQIAIS